jgi:hypothetical protein
MRLKTIALVASAFTGLLFVMSPSASALPGASRADIGVTQPAGITDQVRWRRGWGWGPRRFYRPYAYYGYRPYYYRPYRFYRPYRYYRGWGAPYRHRRFY